MAAFLCGVFFVSNKYLKVIFMTCSDFKVYNGVFLVGLLLLSKRGGNAVHFFVVVKKHNACGSCCSFKGSRMALGVWTFITSSDHAGNTGTATVLICGPRSHGKKDVGRASRLSAQQDVSLYKANGHK